MIGWFTNIILVTLLAARRLLLVDTVEWYGGEEVIKGRMIKKTRKTISTGSQI